MNFASNLNKISKHWIFVDFLLMKVKYKALHERSCSLLLSPGFLLVESSVQGALRKAMLISTFVRRFKTLTLAKLY